MQHEKAKKLHEQWKQLGNEPCDHANLEKEYYLGAATGDYICTQCGAAFYEGERDKGKEHNED